MCFELDWFLGRRIHFVDLQVRDESRKRPESCATRDGRALLCMRSTHDDQFRRGACCRCWCCCCCCWAREERAPEQREISPPSAIRRRRNSLVSSGCQSVLVYSHRLNTYGTKI